MAFTSLYTVTDLSLVLSLSLDTTRLPNVAPYNTFTITCTASVPLGVVSPKTFQWRRQINHNCSEEIHSSLNNNDSINIVSKDPSKPVSTSILSVNETIAGTWSYCCQADLDELNITNINSTSITITGRFCY